MNTLPRLTRSLPATAGAPPVRIVHLGIGNFARAHQAWYTAHAADAEQWGIAAFTGRRPDTAEALCPQDGLFTLITRGPDDDTFEVVGSLAEVRPSTDHDRFLDLLTAPTTALVTITVTEAGYRLGADQRLNSSPEVVADIEALRGDPRSLVATLPAKLVAGLLARRGAGGGALTVLSCDNLPNNGAVTQTVVAELAAAVDPSLSGWIAEQVDFASSVVDRITAATTDADRCLVAERAGYLDEAPVPTEPFREWVVAGTFPAGRPCWESAGALVVDDVGAHEQRKLTLLNGSHSLMAYTGSIRGHECIDDAVADPTVLRWVEAFWDEAGPHLRLPAPEIGDYRSALLARYRNPRIRHRLAQIAADGSAKIPVRILPTVRAERAAGRLPLGCAAALAGWVLHLRGIGAPVTDSGAERYIAAAASSDVAAGVHAVLHRLDRDLGADQPLISAVVGQATELIR